ncbi:MAG: hypothetical protein ACTSR8_01950 [Promethearchaeota archaeon]
MRVLHPARHYYQPTLQFGSSQRPFAARSGLTLDYIHKSRFQPVSSNEGLRSTRIFSSQYFPPPHKSIVYTAFLSLNKKFIYETHICVL